MDKWTPEQWILIITTLSASIGGLITSIIAAVKSGRAATASKSAEAASTAHTSKLDDIHTQTNGTLARQIEAERGLRTALAEEKMRSAALQAEIVRRADLAMPPQSPLE